MNCPEKEKKSRKQLFSKQWLEEDTFKGWLESMEDAAKVRCKCCNLVLGTKSDLLKHEKCQKHKKNIKTLQVTRTLTDKKKRKYS